MELHRLTFATILGLSFLLGTVLFGFRSEVRKAPDPGLVDRLLTVIEDDIVPRTRQGVSQGSKVFGAAILRKADRSLVVAASNNERDNPLWHAEVHAIKLLYELPPEERHAPKESLFVATHEPCSLCLSAITWGGYDNFYYLFSHEDSRDSFAIPHDLNILKEVFTLDPGGYAATNAYWESHDIMEMIGACDEPDRQRLLERVERLKKVYAELSTTYQANKGRVDIPLK